MVSIVTRIRSGQPGNQSSIPGRGKYCIYFPKGPGRFWGPSNHLLVGKRDSSRSKADDSLYVKWSYKTHIPHMPLGVHRSKFTSLCFLKRVSVLKFLYYSCNNAALLGLLNGTNIWSQYNSCVFFVSGGPHPFSDNFSITDCTKPPCKLKRNTNVTMEFKFTPGKWTFTFGN